MQKKFFEWIKDVDYKKIATQIVVIIGAVFMVFYDDSKLYLKLVFYLSVSLASIVILYGAYDYFKNIRPIIYEAGVKAGAVEGMTTEKLEKQRLKDRESIEKKFKEFEKLIK